MPELTPPRLRHAERRDAGRATGSPPCHLGQLELERAILTLELGEPRLETGEVLLDWRPRDRCRGEQGQCHCLFRQKATEQTRSGTRCVPGGGHFQRTTRR